MKKVILICDRCKREIKKGELTTKLYVQAFNMDTGEKEAFDERQQGRDYHADCVREILNYANQIKGEESGNKPDNVNEKMDSNTDEPKFMIAKKEQLKEKKEPESSEPEELAKKKANPEKEEKRNKLDIGKIIALKNAGWTHAKIAEEMGTTKACIASTIYTYRNKKQQAAVEAKEKE